MIASTLLMSLLLQGTVPVPVLPGAVSGQLKTIDGAPAVNTRIVMVPAPKGANRVDDNLNYYEPYFSMPQDRTLTDNEGNFRLQDIVPGRYFLLAGAAAEGQGTYYPDALIPRNAQVLDIVSAEELNHLDFQLKVRLGGRLSGRVNANMTALGPRTATITGGKLEDLLEVPVNKDGTFAFGHVPPGKYLLSLYPPTPGIASMPITVANDDVSGAELLPLPTKRVSGRIVVKNGSIPHGLLGFYTVKTWVTSKINDNGTFSVDLHDAQHQIDFAGLPVGYTVASVKIGSQDVTAQGIRVANADVPDVLITLNAPKKLATVKGKITGLPPARFASTGVVMVGPTFNKGLADVQQDGSFQFDAVVPGLYTLSLNGVPEFKPMTVVVEGFDTYEVSVTVPSL
jgi:hypothetical protein